MKSFLEIDANLAESLSEWNGIELELEKTGSREAKNTLFKSEVNIGIYDKYMTMPVIQNNRD